MFLLKPFKLIFLTLYSVWGWMVCLFCFATHGFLAFLFARFTKDPSHTNFMWACSFIKLGFFLLGIKFNVMGLEKLPKESPVLILSNHQSILDIVALMAGLDVRFSFFAKEELLKVPLVRQDILYQDHFIIDRFNPRKAVKQMAIVKQKVLTGRNMLIFPEGTRSKDGSILPFKRGPFMIAAETKTTVVPCYINGAQKMIQKGSLIMRPGVIDIVIDNPISVQPESTDKKSLKEFSDTLSDKTRSQIMAMQRSIQEKISTTAV